MSFHLDSYYVIHVDAYDLQLLEIEMDAHRTIEAATLGFHLG